MSSNLATTTDGPAIIGWKEQLEEARGIVSSGMLPKHVKTAEQFIVIAAMGRELGLQPLAATRMIHVIEGTPKLSSEAMAGLVLKRYPNAVLWPSESEESHCTMLAGRPGQEIPAEFTYTIEDARRAGLLGKDNWKKHPKSMLRARATAQAVRSVFPEVSLGVYSDDEDTGAELAAPGQTPRSTTTEVIVSPEEWAERMRKAKDLGALEKVAAEAGKERMTGDERKLVANAFRNRRKGLKGPPPEAKAKSEAEAAATPASEPPPGDDPPMREPGDDSYPDAPPPDEASEADR